jgi:hypothetical protein
MVLDSLFLPDENNRLNLDMQLIKKLALSYDKGLTTDTMLIAKIIVSAYEAGLEDGREEAETSHMHTQMLLLCTAGNA